MFSCNEKNPKEQFGSVPKLFFSQRKTQTIAMGLVSLLFSCQKCSQIVIIDKLAHMALVCVHVLWTCVNSHVCKNESKIIE